MTDDFRKAMMLGRERAIREVLEIIDEDIGEHIYRDAFRTREDLKKLYDRVRSHVKSLEGEQG